jgi:hypothetical protein
VLLDYLSVRLASTLSGDPGVLQSYYRFSRHLSTLFADDVEVDQLDVDGNLCAPERVVISICTMPEGTSGGVQTAECLLTISPLHVFDIGQG